MNVFLIVSYDGSCFQGFQIQPGLKTVQGELEKHLTELLQEKILIIGSGRTDAGVHAIGQPVNFKTNCLKLPLEKVTLLLNRSLRGEIVVRQAAFAPPDFHARYSAKGKVYLYWMRLGGPEPWLRKYCWFWEKRPIDTANLRETMRIFVGEHDFAGFAVKLEPQARKNTVRKLLSAEIVEVPGGVIMTFEGEGFLRGMVRVMTSAAVHCAAGYLDRQDLIRQLEKPGAVILPPKAPPNGLYLGRVFY
ncbi:MAG: tRNA pseudouridine(38-40) synthase TruA [Candidatus Wallbacteria bacterium]|nr:tRNA pseudouridine(38-40) synthase TruA [Candidatus Wallbacteria bacterium]